MITARVMGTGSFLPEKIVTNEDLSKIVETNDEWIRSRTGIKERRIDTQNGTTKMATIVATRVLEDAKTKAEEVELIIVATLSADSSLPNTSCEVQREIGAKKAVCFDLNVACSGFLFAMNIANAFIQLGLYKTALIIGAENMSKMIDWTDRGTCVLFGDGAGGVVLKADKNGIMDMVMYSDGEKGDALTCINRNLNNFLVENHDDYRYIRMNGQEVFKFAVKKVPESILELMNKNNITSDEIKYFVLHQANSRIIQSVAKRLKVDETKFPMNLESYGNTSAASVPILLDDMTKKGMLQRGDKIILSGFGAGLTWGATLMEW